MRWKLTPIIGFRRVPRRTAEIENHDQVIAIRIGLNSKIKFSREGHHSLIFRQHLGYDSFEFFIAAALNQPANEFGSHAFPLMRVSYQDRNFCFWPTAHFGEPTYGQNPVRAGFWILKIRNQRHFSVVVDEAVLQLALREPPAHPGSPYGNSGEKRCH